MLSKKFPLYVFPCVLMNILSIKDDGLQLFTILVGSVIQGVIVHEHSI